MKFSTDLTQLAKYDNRLLVEGWAIRVSRAYPAPMVKYMFHQQSFRAGEPITWYGGTGPIAGKIVESRHVRGEGIYIKAKLKPKYVPVMHDVSISQQVMQRRRGRESNIRL